MDLPNEECTTTKISSFSDLSFDISPEDTNHYMRPSSTSTTNRNLISNHKHTITLDQTLALRRERNREYSKRSRVRKKFLLESLQNKVKELDEENEKLRRLTSNNNENNENAKHHDKNIIASHITKSNSKIEDFHVTKNKTNVVTHPPKEIKQTIVLSKRDQSLIKCITNKKHNYLITDPHFPDNPIVFASDEFFQMSGYTREQIIGKNCRFLQGPHTDPKAVDSIRTAVLDGIEVCVTLLNYKVDRTPFWNQFFVTALRDDDNFIINYIGIQYEVEFHNGMRACEVGVMTNRKMGIVDSNLRSSSLEFDHVELNNFHQVDLIDI